MKVGSESGRNYICGKRDDNLCDGSSDLVCVVKMAEREKRRGKNNFMFVGNVVRQSRMKGVLIRKWCGVNKWVGNNKNGKGKLKWE